LTDNSPPVRTRLAPAAGAGLAAVLAVATPFVAQWEGGRLRDGSAIGYADRLAHGLPTACEGATGPGIVVGRHYTREQCDALLRDGLTVRLNRIRSCLPADLSAKTMGAALSLSYNIGTQAFCRSTVSARFRAGNYRAACDGFLAWNRSAGVVRQGLVNRRNAERRLCLEGL